MSNNQPIPKVSVAMLAYNHGKFIAQAIEGVMMQKTDFPVELVIGEDDSNDDTREICIDYARRYPDRIRLYLRNRSDPERLKCPPTVFFNWVETLKACRGEYIALLDGDDYWTDDKKLEIQTRVLEQHPETVMCSHRFKILNDISSEITNDTFEAHFRGQEHLTSTFQNFLDPSLILTSCVVFRRAELQGFWQKNCVYDTSLWAHLLSRGGNLLVLNRVMGVYRRHPGGVWSMLPPHESNKRAFEQFAMVAANEGLSSRSIKREFFRTASQRSDDLFQETCESLNAWKSYVQEVLTIVGKWKRFPPRLNRAAMGLLFIAEDRLLEVQRAYLGLAHSPRRLTLWKIFALARLGLWLAAASPLGALAVFTRLHHKWMPQRKGRP